MRRISPAFALAALLLFPSAALAQQHHQMAINEVLLSNGGDDAVQYIELRDLGLNGEPFPDDYVLGVYDVDGVSLGSVPLAIDGGGENLTDWYVATTAADAAFGPDGQDELTIALPLEGQVCFERTTGTKFSCVAWGCVNTVLTGGMNNGEGASPADGTSLGRQANGTYTIGDPTPAASNDVGDPMSACPTDPDAGPSEIDAGTVTGDDGGPGNPDGGGGSGDGGDGDDDSGCGCGVNGDGHGAASFALVAFALVAGFRRRRRS